MDQLPDIAVGFQKNNRYILDKRIVEDDLAHLPAEREIPCFGFGSREGGNLFRPKEVDPVPQGLRIGWGNAILVFKRLKKTGSASEERGQRLGRFKIPSGSDLLPQPVVFHGAPEGVFGRIGCAALDRIGDCTDLVERFLRKAARSRCSLAGRQADVERQCQAGFHRRLGPGDPFFGRKAVFRPSPGVSQIGQEMLFLPLGVCGGESAFGERFADLPGGKVRRFPFRHLDARIKSDNGAGVSGTERVTVNAGDLFVKPAPRVTAVDPPARDFGSVTERPFPENFRPLRCEFGSDGLVFWADFQTVGGLGFFVAVRNLARDIDKKFDSPPGQRVGHFHRNIPLAAALAVLISGNIVVSFVRGVEPSGILVHRQDEIIGAGRDDLIGDPFDPELPLQPVGIPAPRQKVKKHPDLAAGGPNDVCLRRKRRRKNRRDRGKKEQNSGKT